MNEQMVRRRLLKLLISSLLGVIWLLIFHYVSITYPLAPALILGVFFPTGAMLLHIYIYLKTPPVKTGWFIIATFGMALMPVSGILGPAGIILLPAGFLIWLFCIGKAYKQ
ncbi:hypothetical protein KEJ32_04380 [Candidatus Bathyarchaeota archaeon]|nr:hypothetical protein [Candidatus Bathyarchaeota archaeon]